MNGHLKRIKLLDLIDVLQAQLKRNNDGKGYYFGDKISIADIFVCDFIWNLRIYVMP